MTTLDSPASPAPAQPPRRGRPRLAALDGLRLIAALAVVGYHYLGVSTGYWGQAPHLEFPSLNVIARYGYLGVNLFFVISGFVILMTAYDRGIEEFTASRVARLFPAYWVVVIATVALQQFWDEGRRSTVMDGLINLTMTQGAYDVMNVQGAFWTLWIELKFYLLVGLLVVIGMTRLRALAFAALWPLIGQIAVATHTGFLSSLLFPTYAPYFAVGIALFLLRRERHDLATWLVLIFNTILCMREASNYAARASHHVGAEVDGPVAALIVLGAIVLVYACAFGPVSRIGWGWLTFAGALTYPLYLVHGQLGFFVIDQLQSGMNSYLVVAIAVAASLALAVVLNLVVERPLAPRLRRAVAQGLYDEGRP